MKRILAAILTAAMILAAVPALGDKPDPIIGAWYADSTDGTTHIVSVYVFDAAGYLTIMMLDFEPSGYKKSASVEPFYAGSWKQVRDNVYKVLASSGAYYARAEIYMDGDRLYIPVQNGKYWSFRRMEHFQDDIYTDTQVKDKFAQ